MALEIEHKFLLANDQWRKSVSRSVHFRQGYLSSAASTSIRVRLCGDHAWLNIKSATVGHQRHEFEYPIPCADAEEILEMLCTKPLIEKTRHYVEVGAHTWEIDEFEGANEGLIVAEIELQDTAEAFSRPPWLGPEVTYELRYYNNNLAHYPFREWQAHEKKPDPPPETAHDNPNN
ncbi:MAG: CYTH domain-containing protein [Pseudomonadota bacterium]